MKKTMTVTGYYPVAELEQGEHGASLPKDMRFNLCDHMVVKVEGGEDTRMNTVVLDTPFGVMTVCVIPWADGSTGGCLDIQYKGDKFKQTMIGFTEGQNGDQRIHGADLFSLDLREKKPTSEVPSESALECVKRLVSMAQDEKRKAERFKEKIAEWENKDEFTRKHWEGVVQKHHESERYFMRAARALCNEHRIDIRQFKENS